MAKDLERMVQPDEQVLFETGGSRRAALLATALAAVVTPALTVGVTAAINGLSGGLTSLAITMGAAMAGTLPALYFASGQGAAALVTDIRVIYRQGLLRPRVTEIPLWHIAEITGAGLRLTLAGRGGETYKLPSLPEQEKLALAILRQTNVAAPADLRVTAESEDAAEEDDDD